MLIDGDTVPAGATVHCDLCIVGAGPAGMTLAHELEGTGLRLCVLESGGLDGDDGAQRLTGGTIGGDWWQPLHETRVRQVGGTAHRWAERIGFREAGGRFLPLSPIDFERRDWLPHSGWPFGFDALRPYYRRAQRVAGIGRFAYDGADWETAAAPVLPLPAGRIGTRVFQIGRRTSFTSRHRDALLASRHTTLYTHATALQLQTNTHGSAITRVCVAARAGQRFSVAARTFVLALGGIENARLLLLSTQRCKAGLGNEHDLVGRFLMDHPQLPTGVLLPFGSRIFRSAALYDVRAIGHTPVMGHLAPTDDALRAERLPHLGMMLFPKPHPDQVAAATALWRLVREPQSGMQRAGRLALRHGARQLGYLGLTGVRFLARPQPFVPQHGWGGWSVGVAGGRGFVAFETYCLTEQAPHPENRVMLDRTCDHLGQRRARVEWHWTEHDRHELRRALAHFADAFAAAEIGYYRPSLGDERPTLSHHHMGTTRMHDDPRRGVVDANSRVHGLDNLYVAGSSVFPTGGYANPTLTIIALAIRLASHLNALHARGPQLAVPRPAARQKVPSL